MQNIAVSSQQVVKERAFQNNIDKADGLIRPKTEKNDRKIKKSGLMLPLLKFDATDGELSRENSLMLLRQRAPDAQTGNC